MSSGIAAKSATDSTCMGRGEPHKEGRERERERLEMSPGGSGSGGGFGGAAVSGFGVAGWRAGDSHSRTGSSRTLSNAARVLWHCRVLHVFEGEVVLSPNSLINPSRSFSDTAGRYSSFFRRVHHAVELLLSTAVTHIPVPSAKIECTSFLGLAQTMQSSRDVGLANHPQLEHALWHLQPAMAFRSVP